MTKTQMTNRFNDLHKSGSDLFGANWITMNSTVIEAADEMIDITTIENRLLLTKIAFKILAKQRVSQCITK